MEIGNFHWKNSRLEQWVINNYPQGWEDFFDKAKDILIEISDVLAQENRHVWPLMSDVFNIFYMCRPDQIKCIIVGQDPYPNKSACGLAFSTKGTKGTKEIQSTPSMKNILKKLQQEGYTATTSNLEKWVKNGVFLINTALTVPEGGNHLKLWKPFTDLLFEYLKYLKNQHVWILWGVKAQAYQKYGHKVITGGHPSPANGLGNFLSSDYFNKCNEYLTEKIDWNL